MALAANRSDFTGSVRPYPGQLWRRDDTQVIVIAASQNTVTYDNLSKGGRVTESLDAFMTVFRRMKR
jgi:hypothetical protein